MGTRTGAGSSIRSSMSLEFIDVRNRGKSQSRDRQPDSAGDRFRPGGVEREGSGANGSTLERTLHGVRLADLLHDL